MTHSGPGRARMSHSGHKKPSKPPLAKRRCRPGGEGSGRFRVGTSTEGRHDPVTAFKGRAAQRIPATATGVVLTGADVGAWGTAIWAGSRFGGAPPPVSGVP